jgi:hypothetical protein
VKTVEEYAEEIGRRAVDPKDRAHAVLALIDVALIFEKTDEARVTAIRRILDADKIR